MDQQLNDLINGLYAFALDYGLSPVFPVELTYGDALDSNGRDIDVIVSVTEPSDVYFANIVWLNTDEASPDYLKLFVRASKEAGGIYSNTWTQLTTFAAFTAIDQVYDVEDHIRPTSRAQIAKHDADTSPHANYKVITDQGGELVGKLLPRAMQNSQAYDLTEAIPRRTLVDALNSQTNGFYAILQNMNNQLNQARTDINSLKTRVAELENGGGGGTPGQSYVEDITVASNEWIIHHQLNTFNLSIEVWSAVLDTQSGTTRYHSIIPEEKVMFDANFTVITFGSPLVGKVIIRNV